MEMENERTEKDQGLTQMGAVSLTVMLNSWGIRSPLSTGLNPESKPVVVALPAPSGWQGLAKED